MKLHEMKAQKEQEAKWVPKQPCLVCSKSLSAPYGRHADGWTCSAKCEKEYDRVPVHDGEGSPTPC